MVKEKNKNQILLSRKSSRVMLIDDEKKLLVAIEKYLLIVKYRFTIFSYEHNISKVKKYFRLDFISKIHIFC